MSEETIFHAALERPDPAGRAAYLDEACAGDADLRRRIEALLRAHDEPGGLLESNPGGAGLAPTLPATAAEPAPTGGEPTRTWPSDPDATTDAGSAHPGPAAEGPGARIGPYTLAERIGEGGMGVVYRAEQVHPVRRTVALKVIRAGMDTEQVVARFEAERQALALMEHPNIARVLDAGATPAGRPFFVMELVRGVPITTYCDDARLTPRQRLELFLPVCRAIQHAHQKGIIHRDIKPSNVLVAEVDGVPVPKVIDFGVAKAIDQRLTERSLFTRLGAIVGTPEYMSPEQAAPTDQDVDTRGDVYSLGVLLYELLTGTTPLDRRTLRRAALEEVLRRVRDAETPRPSARLSGVDERLASIAAVRGTEPSRLARLVRGDLDWVVMKALEKDRARRYEAVGALARDVRRFLDGDPVEAGPPSRTYRHGKFARKHRAGLATAAAFALLLVAATAVSTWQAWRATHAEGLAIKRLKETRLAKDATAAALADTRRAQAATAEALSRSEEARKQAEAVSAFLVSAFRSPDPREDGRQVKVIDILDRAAKDLEKDFTGSPRTRGDLLTALGRTYLGLGQEDRAVEVFAKAHAAREAALGPDHIDTIRVRTEQAMALIDVGRPAEAVELLEATFKQLEAKLGPDHTYVHAARDRLATAYQYAGRVDEAIALREALLKQAEAKLGPDHLETLTIRSNLASAYYFAGRLAEAVPLMEATLKSREAKLGPDHPETLTSRDNLATSYREIGRAADSIPLYETTLRVRAAKLGPDHPETFNTRHALCVTYFRLGRLGEAIAQLEPLLKAEEAKLGPDHPATLDARNSLAQAYLRAGMGEKAVALQEAMLELMEAKHGPDYPRTLESRKAVASALLQVRQPAAAIAPFESLLKTLVAQFGTDHPSTLRCRNGLAVAGLR